MTDTLLKQVHDLYKKHEEIPYIAAERDLSIFLKKIQLGTESLVPKRNMIRTPEGLLPGDIILIWRIALGTYTTESWTPKYFEYDYGIHCEGSLDMLLDQGYARKYTATESLVHVPATVLKSILKSEVIKGYSKLNKEQLMDVVSQSISEDRLAELIDIRGYELTDKGQAALDNNPEVIDRHPKKNLG